MAGLLFGIGFGMFDANNMPILCQFVSAKYRATAYGIMNMAGVFAGAAVTDLLGKWTDGGAFGAGICLFGGGGAAGTLPATLFPPSENGQYGVNALLSARNCPYLCHSLP